MSRISASSEATFDVLFRQIQTTATAATGPKNIGPSTRSDLHAPDPPGIRLAKSSLTKPQEVLFAQALKSLNEEPNHIGEVTFKSALIEGPSNSGLSTVLLQLAKAREVPAIFIVNNRTHYIYLAGILKHLDPNVQINQDYPLLQKNHQGLGLNKYFVADEDKAKPKVFFVTKNALASNCTDLEELVEKLQISQFYYDDISNLKSSSGHKDHESEEALSVCFRNLCTLLDKAQAKTPDAQIPGLIGSLNYPFHDNLHDDFYHGADEDIGRLFPSKARYGLSRDRTTLGLASINQDRLFRIDFPKIEFKPDIESPTVSRILRNSNNSDEYSRALESIINTIKTLKGKTLIRTINREVAHKIQESLQEKGVNNVGLFIDKANPKFLQNFLEAENGEDRFLIGANSFSQIHLPEASYDNFVYLDAPTSSRALASDLSIATGDPNVKIYYLRPLAAPNIYKFPDRSYKPVTQDLTPRRTTREDYGFPSGHIEIIESAIQKTNIKNQKSWSNFLSQIIARLEQGSSIGDSKLVESFIRSSLETAPEPSALELRNIIKGDSYNPEIFRNFINFIFTSPFSSNLHEWYQGRDPEYKSSVGLDDLNTQAMIKAYPRLMGVFGLEEARLVLSNFSAIHQFHLGLIEGFNIPNSFSTKDRLELLLNLLSFLRIDTNLLMQELNLDKEKIAGLLKQHLERYPINSTEDLTQIATLISNYHLLTKLFSGLDLQIGIPVQSGANNYLLNLTINHEKVQLTFRKQGESQ